jgi:hypothetical protein
MKLSRAQGVAAEFSQSQNKKGLHQDGAALDRYCFQLN